MHVLGLGTRYSGRTCVRCKKLVPGVGTEVSGLDPVLSAGLHWPGTSPPGRLPRLTSARADIDNSGEQHQPKDPMRSTNELGVVMTAKGKLNCSLMSR